jgi:hypothetical protein
MLVVDKADKPDRLVNSGDLIMRICRTRRLEQSRGTTTKGWFSKQSRRQARYKDSKVRIQIHRPIDYQLITQGAKLKTPRFLYKSEAENSAEQTFTSSSRKDREDRNKKVCAQMRNSVLIPERFHPAGEASPEWR